MSDRDAKPEVSITWHDDRDDVRWRRVTEILLEIMQKPVDSEPTPAEGRER